MEKIDYERTTLAILDQVEKSGIKVSAGDLFARAQVYATLAVAQAIRESNGL